MFSRILIPLDMSETAEQTLAYVKQLLWSNQTRLILVSVVDQGIQTRSDFLSRKALFPNLAPETESAFEAYLEEIVEALRKSQYRASAYVMNGDPATCIVDIANELDADLIAMAPHGRGQIARAMIGSVSDKVIRSTNRPVLLVRDLETDPTPGKVTRILVPLDGSVHAEHVLHHAKEIAHQRGAEIMLLRTVEPLSAVERNVLRKDDIDPTDAESQLRLEAEAYLHKFHEQLLADRFNATYEVHIGPAADAILDAAGRDVDLIVMSSHGLTSDARWAVGSVATAVLNRATCPILIERQLQMTPVSPTMMGELSLIEV